MRKKKIIIIGAGPGGLAAGLLLSSKGHNVTIYEKKPYVGGRNSSFNLGNYTFDLGPTFFLMPKLLEDIFIEAGERLDEHINLMEINPMYRLKFYGIDDFNPYSHSKKFLMYGEMEKIFPYSSRAYDRYIKSEERKFSKLEPCLKVPYLSLIDYLKPNFLKALPYLDAHKSIYDVLGGYYKEEELKNVKNISENKDIGGDFSFYVQNPSVIDHTLAPEGKSSIYVLVPVANNSSKIDWELEKDDFVQLLLDKLEKIGEFKGIRDHIEELRVITPKDWEMEYDIYRGSVFNLSHTVMQMLWFRPHNKLEGYKNLFIVGGGTHPGSGLPTIYCSAKIVADLIEKIG